MTTLEQIAKEAGVSTVTVSNVLNGKNKETWPSAARRADEIRRIATRLGYRPNAAAKAMATGRFGGIGLMLSTDEVRGAFFESAWPVLRQVLRERDLHLTVGDLPEQKLTDTVELPKMLRELSVDGLLINYISDIPPGALSMIQQQRVPSIWMNVQLESDCAYPDDFRAAQEATAMLLKMGHRRVAYVDHGSSTHYSALARRDGYVSAMRSAGLAPRIIADDTLNSTQQWRSDSQQWLQDVERPTAVLTYEADRVLPIYCAAIDLGLKVPTDLSLLTFHQQTVVDVGVTITTMRIPVRDMVQSAVQMLIEKINDPTRLLPPVALPFTLAEGQTCAPPRTN